MASKKTQYIGILKPMKLANRSVKNSTHASNSGVTNISFSRTVTNSAAWAGFSSTTLKKGDLIKLLR
jgi:hypothetical protein